MRNYVIPEALPEVPVVKPIMGERTPTTHPALEIPTAILDQLRTVSVTRNDICRIAAKDRCAIRLKSKLALAQAQALPKQQLIAAAKIRLKKLHQYLVHLQTSREQRAMTVKLLKMQLLQRLMTIAEQEEGRRARAIRVRISPEFQDETSFEPTTPAKETPSKLPSS